MKNIDAYFELARQEAPNYSLDEVNAYMQTHFTKALRIKSFSAQIWILSVAVVSILFLVSYHLKSEKKSAAFSKGKITVHRKVKLKQHPNSIQHNKPLQQVHPFLQEEPLVIEANHSLFTPTLDVQVENKDILHLQPLTLQKKPIDQGHFPSFTQEEIAQNNKRKKELVKSAFRVDKKYYADLYDQGFGLIVQKTEITNWAYRTFLTDLAIQNEREKYELAKPNLDLWIQLPFGMANQLREHYFSHPAFDQYPVLTISRKGAELYCEWLSNELQKMANDKKTSTFLVRLPSREEWIKVASNNGALSPYPWNGIYLRDYRGLYLANLNTWNSEPYHTEEDGGMYSVPVTYYSTNALGLYNMSGNAAEMVYEDLKSKIPGTAGGSWMSSPEEIKIHAPDPYAGIIEPSPYIGFRIVMIRNTNTTPPE